MPTVDDAPPAAVEGTAAPASRLMSRVWSTRRPGDRLELLVADRSVAAYVVARAQPDDHQRLFRLPDRDGRINVGRDPLCDLVLDWDPAVAAVHAALDRMAGRWVVRREPGCRVVVNGQDVMEATPLDDGDVLCMGTTPLLFRDLTRGRLENGTLAASAMAPRCVSITETQRRVLVALARPVFASPPSDAPAANRDIAVELGVSVAAVKKHLNGLVQAFDLQDVPQREKRRRLLSEAQAAGVIGLRDYAGSAVRDERDGRGQEPRPSRRTTWHDRNAHHSWPPSGR
ncbi:MAG: FHA domain-containing protein [Thermoleophilia bacterium]